MFATRRLPVAAAIVSALALAGATPALAAPSAHHSGNLQAAGFCSGSGAVDAATAVQQDWNTLRKYGNKVHGAGFVKELKADVACYPAAERLSYKDSVLQMADYLKTHPKLKLTVRWGALRSSITSDTWTSPNVSGSALVSVPGTPAECMTLKQGKSTSKGCGLYSPWGDPSNSGLDLAVQSAATGAWFVSSQTPGTVAPTSPVATPAADATTCDAAGYTGAPSAAQAAQENFNTLQSGNTAMGGLPLDFAANLTNQLACITGDQQSLQQNIISSVGSWEMQNTGANLAVTFESGGPIDAGPVYTSESAPNSAIVTDTNMPLWSVSAYNTIATSRYTPWLEGDTGYTSLFTPLQREAQNPTTGMWFTDVLPPGFTMADAHAAQRTSLHTMNRALNGGSAHGAHRLRLPGLRPAAHGGGRWLAQLGL